MLAKTYSCGINGLDVYQVAIEVDVTRGLPATIIVGLPDNAIKESKERVRSAIKNSGFKYPQGRITINLSPADTKKQGPAFDLAIALGILAASQQIQTHQLNKYILLGELSLDGHVQPISGVLPVALNLSKPKTKMLIIPFANESEAAMAQSTNVFKVSTLNEIITLINNPDTSEHLKINPDCLEKTANSLDIDFADVKGQSYVKRGLEIAAAGNHNCLLIGSPGVGKSMLAKRFPTILPDMTMKEALETTKIYSVMGLLKNKGVMTTRPFRSPHHTTSAAAIVGGGSNPKPGEVTLSHNGVLFLDELPEFQRNVLESLRQPLEDQVVTISRANKSLEFPCRFILLAAMNPTPTGRLSDETCPSYQIQKYMSKLSGPLLDRIDLHLDVPDLPSKELFDYTPSENSQTIKLRTTNARNIQHDRFKDLPILTNSQMSHKQIKNYCAISDESKDLLQKAINELNLSARAYDKILKVSRTIADLAEETNILTEHIAEAIQYRNLDRNWS